MSDSLPIIYLARHGETQWTIRVLAARWLGADPSAPGKHFMLSTASLSAVGYEHDRSRPVIRLWNDDHHVGD